MTESAVARQGGLAVKPGRLVSLDIFRGMTIAGMLLVNNQGDWDHVFSPLEHAEWNGCTATDLIFPFFLFIMGVAMPLSLGRRLEKGERPAALLPHIVKRMLVLIALGLFLNLIMCSALEIPLRWPGVLQRIGICYAVASVFLLWTGEKTWIVATGVLLIGYYLAMWLVPIPGGGARGLAPSGNLADWVDSRILGQRLRHWDAATGWGHDPEGLFSTLPAIASTLIGCLAGSWLKRAERGGYEKAAGMFAAGVALVVLGAAWSLGFPMNKNLWTSSYVLYAGGWALLGYAACYWLVDLKGSSAWGKPFLVYGVNAIAAYVGAHAMGYTSILIRWHAPDGSLVRLKGWVYDHLYRSWIPGIAGDYISSAAYGMTYVVLWCAIAWVLYRRRIFIKV